MKKIVALALSATMMAQTAFAGGLSPVIVETPVIEEQPTSSISPLVLLGILVVVGVLITQNDPQTRRPALVE